ncbi:putative motility protein [Roseateles sp. GG27B]
MNLSNTALVNNASASDTPDSVPGNAQTFVLKKATSLQAEGVAELLASVSQTGAPAPTLANSGTVGTQLNTYA